MEKPSFEVEDEGESASLAAIAPRRQEFLMHGLSALTPQQLIEFLDRELVSLADAERDFHPGVLSLLGDLQFRNSNLVVPKIRRAADSGLPIPTTDAAIFDLLSSLHRAASFRRFDDSHRLLRSSRLSLVRFLRDLASQTTRDAA